MRRKALFLMIASALLATSNVLHAKSVGKGVVEERPAITKPRSGSLFKRFVYKEDSVYEIKTRAGMFTHIELPQGETVYGFYLSDTTLWNYVVSQDGSRILVRPSEEGLYNSGTLVTNKRVYELAFQSFSVEEPHWYQRVQWLIEPEKFLGWGVFADPAEKKVANVGAAADPKAAASEGKEGGEEGLEDWLIDMRRAYFGYLYDRSVPGAPELVFDDGVFTYLRFPKRAEMPAIFIYDEDPNKARIVDYVVRGDSVLVHRVPRGGLLLKLDGRTIVIERTGDKR